MQLRGEPGHVRPPSFSGAPSIQEEPRLLKLALPLVRESVKSVVDDSFNRCFESHAPERWNWGHLFLPYCFGVIIRYAVLFPIRLAILLGGVLILLLAFFFVKVLVCFEMSYLCVLF